MTLDPRVAVALQVFNEATVDRSGTPAERRERALARRATNPQALIATGPDMHLLQDVLVPTVHGPVPVRIYRPRAGVLPA